MSETFIDRKMRDKNSVFKCLACEKKAQSHRDPEATLYLFTRTGRGNKCPYCGCTKVTKISISVVIEQRWGRSVMPMLASLRGTEKLQVQLQTSPGTL